ncbi:anthranilate synthase component II [Lutibaculum baratangense]|uniref:Anthranilate synthase component II n=1 Tax=Lutibaculum baratangense AMV1 TaxID=631454 RepID=V4R535_9HYPH|nr:aminodeoxychorismate/anthranilate synthase component II [Lutibaculum baratangense]ESR27052.1 anthranilate synthase component II [Lutibaculum baratangense AMV1]
MILVVDNYDSFVFTVARYLVELGMETKVVRNDAVDADDVLALRPSAVVLSPGPCGPREAGHSLDIVRRVNGRIPLLGVCLGHQCIGEAFGGTVGRAREPMHGRASAIHHDGTGIFRGLPSPFRAGRYHSLAVEIADEAASPLIVTARSENGEIMGLAHRATPTYGVQFHPESVLTEHGHRMLANFLDIAREWQLHAVA